MAKVSWFKPVRARKDTTCFLCRRRIAKGIMKYTVSLDVGAQFPKTEHACWNCWKAGRIAKGAEIELPETAEASR